MTDGSWEADGPRDRPASAARRGQLALALQEVFTATARLRANRQVAADADSFRTHIKQLLSGAEREARRLGYAGDDVATALYAVVVFLDESVLNSAQPMFAGWPSRPLQEELFGGHMGGEHFFQHLRQLLTRSDSDDTADLLEVFQLCLLLGFQGRYSAGDRGELRSLQATTQDKLQRIRGGFGELAPGWAPPGREAPRRERDPWAMGLGIAAAVCILSGALLFGVFRSSLSQGTAGVQAAAGR
ncbi:MAG TPA: DotU family type IV/VI secretion system protein [Gemmatimonadales bacterium]|jgi:type VI secretion system protein ImpK|nr:DotU family type IV/VI secretion system protein [Gemmatimonadales bacterium]